MSLLHLEFTEIPGPDRSKKLNIVSWGFPITSWDPYVRGISDSHGAGWFSLLAQGTSGIILYTYAELSTQVKNFSKNQ